VWVRIRWRSLGFVICDASFGAELLADTVGCGKTNGQNSMPASDPDYEFTYRADKDVGLL
jgi:hypothetical protein